MTDPLDIEKTLKPESAANQAGSAAYTLSPGQSLGQYKIIRPLGRGGMGEVYEAEHQVLRRRYALKLLPAEFAKQQGSLDRFQREAQVMANLEHPNIIKVDEFGETGGRYWLRMELAGGQDSGKIVSLQDLADAGNGRIEQKALAVILGQILDALAYAHERGVIHRDLKPSNILFSGNQAKISDFGLVRLVGEDWVRSQAQLSVQRSMSVGDIRTMQGQASGTVQGSSTRSMLGTFEYMSPEQKRGEDATAQSDLYAVGLMAFKLLTGQNPGVKLPSRIDKSLASGWDDLVERALEEDPAERFSSATEMRIALSAIAQKNEQAQKLQKEKLEAEKRRQAEIHRKQEEAQRLADEHARKIQAEREATENARAARESQRRKATAPKTSKPKKKKLPFLVHLLFVGAVAAGVWWFASSSSVGPGPVRSPPVSQPLQRGPVESQNWTSPATGMEFVWIPAMRMWVGKFEVTNGEYRRKEPRHDSKSFENHSLNGERQPVVYVNFDDAKAFAEWLTQQDRSVLGGTRYRLPSEQEWMTYAQCGDGREYPWGNEWPPPSGRAGNYHGQEGAGTWSKIAGYNDGFPVTAQVDRLWRNPWGLHGVGGNVWEACARDTSGGSFGAWRGASWRRDYRVDLRCSFRLDDGGSLRRSNFGFRLVLSR